MPQEYWKGNEDEEAFVEYTLYHNWLKQWLEWVQWHTLLSCNPDPSLEDLFSYDPNPGAR